MKLGSKTFLYSVIIALIIGIVIFSYMIFLMPGMYMDYKEKQNLENARSSMEYFNNHKSLKNLESRDVNIFGILIPQKGNKIKITGAGFDGEIEFISPTMKELLKKVRNIKRKDAEKGEALVNDFKPIFASIMKENAGLIKKNFRINIDSKKTISQFEAKKQRLHTFGNIKMGEFNVKSKYSGSSYTTFIGFSKKGTDTMIMMNSVITPTAKEILPVLYASTPMLILLMILVAFGVSALYSKKIVDPIKKLSMDAERRMYLSLSDLKPMTVYGKDEIADLTMTLNLLYEKQAQAFRNLEEEIQRKEVYMRATSHQLKTPIAASMLLVDGMTANIGKFADRNVYLPEVKKQLKEMMSIVEEASSISGMADSIEFERVDLAELCRETIGKNRINADSKGIKLELETRETEIRWESNQGMLGKILENLVSNGIKHTEENGSVKVIVEKRKITVGNKPGHIDESISGSIFDPFVTGVDNGSSEDRKGHGLGLYIAKYFAGKLDLKLRGENLQDGVQFVLEKRGRDD